MKHNRGFTLIELMVVCAIIGILASIALPSYQTYIQRSEITEAVSMAGSLKSRINDYYEQRLAFPAEKHRIVVAFQPHRYSRTRDLFDEFATAFNDTDVLFVTDIYPAGEKPIEGVGSGALVEKIRRHGHQEVDYEPDKTALPSRLAEVVKPGDVVLTLGAGDVNQALGALHTLLSDEEGGGSS